MERRTTAHVRPGNSSASFEVVCSEVHPTRCHESLNAASPDALVTLAMQHGAHAHGFTPVWYTRARRATMAAAVTVKHR